MRKWQRETIKTAHDKGWTRTLMGRYRLLRGINSKNRSGAKVLLKSDSPFENGDFLLLTFLAKSATTNRTNASKVRGNSIPEFSDSIAQLEALGKHFQVST